MSIAPIDYLVEILEEQPTEVNTTESSASEIIVEISQANIVGNPIIPEIIEVAVVPPVGAGIKQIETVPFSRQGTLSVATATTEYPIGPGQFVIDSISARVGAAPSGSSIILDVFKNDTTLFPTPADRPTIADGQQNAVMGDFGTVMLAEGDYLEVTIEQVGSAVAGSNLVVSIRLDRVG